MQIQSINAYSNNYSQKSNPNFTSIRSIKCEGLYKKYPELAENLIEAFGKNKDAVEFCKKYDVNIVFYAVKSINDSVRSSLHIMYDNISKSKMRKFFDKLFDRTEDRISLGAHGCEYVLSKSIESSTADLVEKIGPERYVNGKFVGGFLSSHLKFADSEMQKVLNEKAAKSLAQKNKKAAAEVAEVNLKKAKENLKNSVDNLKEKGQ